MVSTKAASEAEEVRDRNASLLVGQQGSGGEKVEVDMEGMETVESEFL